MFLTDLCIIGWDTRSHATQLLWSFWFTVWSMLGFISLSLGLFKLYPVFEDLCLGWFLVRLFPSSGISTKYQLKINQKEYKYLLLEFEHQQNLYFLFIISTFCDFFWTNLFVKSSLLCKIYSCIFFLFFKTFLSSLAAVLICLLFLCEAYSY